jgi:hypothetical protein
VKTIAFNRPTDPFGYPLREKQRWLLSGADAERSGD